MTYSLRVRAKPSIEVRGTSAPRGGGPNDSVSSDRIRVAVSKLLASTWGDVRERGSSTASLTEPTSREARGPWVSLREPLNPALRLWAWRSSRPRTAQQSRALWKPVTARCKTSLTDLAWLLCRDSPNITGPKPLRDRLHQQRATPSVGRVDLDTRTEPGTVKRPEVLLVRRTEALARAHVH